MGNHQHAAMGVHLSIGATLGRTLLGIANRGEQSSSEFSEHEITIRAKERCVPALDTNPRV